WPLFLAAVLGTILASFGATVVAVLMMRAQSEWRAHAPNPGQIGRTPPPPQTPPPRPPPGRAPPKISGTHSPPPPARPPCRTTPRFFVRALRRHRPKDSVRACRRGRPRAHDARRGLPLGVRGNTPVWLRRAQPHRSWPIR